jgi:hypothetical protein
MGGTGSPRRRADHQTDEDWTLDQGGLLGDAEGVVNNGARGRTDPRPEAPLGEEMASARGDPEALRPRHRQAEDHAKAKTLEQLLDKSRQL